MADFSFSPVVSNSYNDPSYGGLEQQAAEKLGNPKIASMLERVRTQGERSNADQVSSAGARSVYQFTPETRDLYLRKYGVDAFAGPDQAALAAAYHLQESLKRNNGDEASAMAEYHAGPNRALWGPKTEAYVHRTMHQEHPQQDAPQDFSFSPVQAAPEAAPAAPVKTQPKTDPAWMPGIKQHAKEGVISSNVGLADILSGGQSLLKSMGVGEAGQNLAEKLGSASPVGMARTLGKRLLGADPLDIIAAKARHLMGADKKVAEPSSEGYKIASNIAGMLGATLNPLSLGGVAAAASPAKAALTEAAAAAASGEGQTMGGKIGKISGHEQAGELIGSMLGPGAVFTAGKGLRTAGSAIGNKLKEPVARTLDAVAPQNKLAQTVAAKLRPTATELQGVAGQQVAREIQAHVGGAEAINRTLELQQKYPSFKPTLPHASGSESLMAQQMAMQRQNPELLAKASAEKVQLDKAVADAQLKAFPKSSMSYQDALNDRVKGMTREARQVASKFERTGQKQFGDQLRELHQGVAQQMRQVSNTKYKAAYEGFAKAGFKADTGDIVQATQKAIGEDAQAWQKQSPVLSQIMNQFSGKTEGGTRTIGGKTFRTPVSAGAPAKVSFEEYHSLYKRLNSEIGQASLRGDAELARRLTPIRDVMGKNIDQLAESKQYGEAATMLKNANSYYAGEIVPKLKQGLGRDIMQKNRYGEMTDSEALLAKVASPTGLTEAAALYGDNPQFQKMLREGIVDSFNRAAMKNGVINPTAAQNYIRKNKEWLDKIPGVRAELSDANKATESILARRSQLTNDAKAMDKDILKHVLKSTDPEADLVQRMGVTGGLADIMNAAKSNPEASQSLARSISTALLKTKDPGAFLKANEAQLKPLMDRLHPGHWQNLKDIADMAKVANRVRTPTTVEPGGYESQMQRWGLDPSSIVSRLTRSIKPTMENTVVYFGNKALGKMKSRDLIKAQEALLFDPEMTATWAKAAKSGTITPAEANKLRDRWVSQGIRTYSVTQRQQSEDDK